MRGSVCTDTHAFVLHLRQYLDLSTRLCFMHLDDTMYNGYIPIIKIEDHYFPNSHWFVTHVEEKNVASVKARLHAST